MKKLEGYLEIRGYDLRVNLGWRDKELAEPQAVVLDIDIRYAQPPAACKSDHLDDTVCYAQMLDKVRAGLAERKFRLLEHLSHEIYNIILPQLPADSRLIVKVTKKPRIDGLSGGVSYTCFNES